jgi:hypothetical protein
MDGPVGHVVASCSWLRDVGPNPMAAFGARFPRHAATVRADEYPSRVARARKASVANSAGHSRAYLAGPVLAGAPESPPRLDRLRPRHMRSLVSCPEGAAASWTEVQLAQCSIASRPKSGAFIGSSPSRNARFPGGDVTANEVFVSRATQPRGLRVARASRRGSSRRARREHGDRLSSVLDDFGGRKVGQG